MRIFNNLFSSSWNLFLTSSLVVGSSLTMTAPALAQMRLSPVVIETQAERNQAQGIIKITNVTDSPFTARLTAKPFTYEQTKGFQSLESSENDLTSHLQFAPRELLLEPNQTRSIRFVSLLPPDLPDGEYRAVVFAEKLTEADPAGGAVSNFKAIIGVTVYVRQGDIASQLEVAEAVWNSDKKQVELVVNNGGKASARPKGSWTLTQPDQSQMEGKFIDTTVVAEGARNFPLSLANAEESELAPGAYKVEGELTWVEKGSRSKENKTLPFALDFTIPAQ